MDYRNQLTLRDRSSSPVTMLPAETYLPGGGGRREPHLLDYLIILRKHQWLILTFLVTVVTIVTIASFKMKPVYVATARVEIDRDNSNASPFQASQDDAIVDLDNYIDTQVKILTSETLAFQTIKSLDLGRYPEFGGHSQTYSSSSGAPQQRPAILGQFLGSLNVKHVPQSQLIEVSFEAQDPQLAARVVNSHLQNFIEMNFRSRYDAAMQASNWLSSELEELRVKMEASENARIQYEKENQIFNVDERANITTEKLADLSKDFTAAQEDLLQKESVYQMAHSGNIDALPSVRDSLLLQQLTTRKADLDQQYTDAVAQFGPNYPRVQRLEAQRKDLDDTIAKEKQDVIARVDEEYHAAQSRVHLLSQALDQQKTDSNDMASKLVEYNVLKHDEEGNKQLYDSLLQKLKEAGITAGLRSSNIRVVDPALTPSFPDRPQKGRNILLALLVGLIGGVGLALFREYLDNTVKTPDDIEALTGLPSLAVVPSFAALTTGQTKLLPSKSLMDESATPATPVALAAHMQPKSAVSEAFRALRTSLLLSQAEHPPKVILVTSALPREGKTTAAVNLAVTLAQLGDRTLLVDSDLRKPGVRGALGLSSVSDVGLSSYLAGVTSLNDAALMHPVIDNLMAMPTGPVPPNPADLLSSHRMRDAIEELRERFKFIVIDSPPIMAATDAVILSALTDGVILVVRSGETPKEAFTRCRDLLAAVNSRVLGVVLNAVDTSGPNFYYAYRYYPYAYGYGEGYGYGEEPENGANRSRRKSSG
jgi:capsular exopolysaccharide synthesis family protein